MQTFTTRKHLIQKVCQIYSNGASLESRLCDVITICDVCMWQLVQFVFSNCFFTWMQMCICRQTTPVYCWGQMLSVDMFSALSLLQCIFDATPKIASSPGGSVPYQINGSLGPPESITQTASWSGQLFLYSIWLAVSLQLTVFSPYIVYIGVLPKTVPSSGGLGPQPNACRWTSMLYIQE